MTLLFEWNENKARLNRKKHGVSFEEAKTIFNDPFQITFLDEFHSTEEERQISIGLSGRRRVLLVVHTERDQSGDLVIICIISARKATPSEQKTYEENEG